MLWIFFPAWLFTYSVYSTPEELQFFTFAVASLMAFLLGLWKIREPVAVAKPMLLVFLYAMLVLVTNQWNMDEAPKGFATALLLLGGLWVSWQGLSRLHGLVYVALMSLFNGLFIACSLVDQLSWFWMYSPFNQENHLQLFNYVTLFALLYFWFEARISKWILALLGAFSLSSLLLADAKACVLSCLAAGIVFTFLNKRSARASRGWVCFGLAFLLVLLVGLAIPFASLTLLQGWTDSSGSIGARIDVWRASFDLWKEHVWWGGGFGSLGFAIRDFWPDLTFSSWPSPLMFPTVAHNHWIQALVETGLIGFFVQTIFWAATVGKALQVALHTKDKLACLLTAFWIGSLPILSFLEVSQLFASGIFLFWFLLAATSFWGARNPRETWILPSRFVKLGALLLILLGCLVWLPSQVHQIQAVSMIQKPFAQGYFAGVEDLNAVRTSMDVSPTSLASIMLSDELANKGFLQEASGYLQLTKSLSGSRWPLDRKQAVLSAKLGACDDALASAQKSLRIRYLTQEPELVFVFQRCLWAH